MVEKDDNVYAIIEWRGREGFVYVEDYYGIDAVAWSPEDRCKVCGVYAMRYRFDGTVDSYEEMKSQWTAKNTQ